MFYLFIYVEISCLNAAAGCLQATYNKNKLQIYKYKVPKAVGSLKFS